MALALPVFTEPLFQGSPVTLPGLCLQDVASMDLELRLGGMAGTQLRLPKARRDPLSLSGRHDNKEPRALAAKIP